MAETAAGAERRWFLDACVLYPGVLRTILLGAAEAGLIRPFWSARVFEEWRIAAARGGGMVAEAEVRAAIEAMRGRYPSAEVAPEPEVEAALRLPDPADAHVAAAAAAVGGADLVTTNLRDFPARRLAALDVQVRHPDGALWELHSRDPAALAPVIQRALDGLARLERGTPRGALRRAGLPRLGKAWEVAGHPS